MLISFPQFVALGWFCWWASLKLTDIVLCFSIQSTSLHLYSGELGPSAFKVSVERGYYLLWFYQLLFWLSVLLLFFFPFLIPVRKSLTYCVRHDSSSHFFIFFLMILFFSCDVMTEVVFLLFKFPEVFHSASFEFLDGFSFCLSWDGLKIKHHDNLAIQSICGFSS